MATVRTTSSLLTMRLGEPASMDMESVPGATIMKYKLTWRCGCRAEGSGNDYLVRPCAAHVSAFSLLAG